MNNQTQPDSTLRPPNEQSTQEVVDVQAAPVAQPQPEERKLQVVENKPAEIQKFEFQQRSARLFAMSGLFSDIKGQSAEQSIAQAYVKIALGDSMGFNPAESMTGIDLIQGRVSVGSNLRAARMQRSGYSWDILQLDDKGCRLALKYNGKPLLCEQIDGETGDVRQVPTVVSFMAEDAARANLIGKDNYKKNPRNMFFARAITNAQRWYAPGILGLDILSTEESIDLEPISTQDTRLAEKTASNVERIKERYQQGQGSVENPPQAQGETVEPQPQEPKKEAEPFDAKAATEKILNHQRATSRQPSQKRTAQRGQEQPGVPMNFSEEYGTEREPGEE